VTLLFPSSLEMLCTWASEEGGGQGGEGLPWILILDDFL